jgi:hypothetical protein
MNRANFLTRISAVTLMAAIAGGGQGSVHGKPKQATH